jgi:hypothetical protein
MAFCKNNAVKCDVCGLFCKYGKYDEEIPFGCKDYDAPEPLDPIHYCEKCSKNKYKEWIKSFKNGGRSGSWQKSLAEQKAAKKCGLVWIHSNGIGKYGTPQWRNYCYITKEEFENTELLNYIN